MDINEYIISQTTGNLYWKDLEGRYLGCNLTFAKMIGLTSPSEIIGKTDEELFLKSLGKERLKLIVDLDKEIISSGQTKTIEEIGIDANKQIAYYLTRKLPLKDNDGNIIGLMGTSINITEIKQANRVKTEFLKNAINEITQPFKQLKALTKIIFKKLSENENIELELIIKSMNQVFFDIKNFAEFNLTEKNQFSDNESLENTKWSIGSSERLKKFTKFYQKFKLTARESECVYHMIRGMSAKQIGRMINLSNRTVEFYLNNAKLKLGCNSRQALISKIFTHNEEASST